MNHWYEKAKVKALPIAETLVLEEGVDVFKVLMEDSDDPRQALFLIGITEYGLTVSERQALLDGLAQEYAGLDGWMAYVRSTGRVPRHLDKLRGLGKEEGVGFRADIPEWWLESIEPPTVSGAEQNRMFELTLRKYGVEFSEKHPMVGHYHLGYFHSLTSEERKAYLTVLSEGGLGAEFLDVVRYVRETPGKTWKSLIEE